VPCYTTVEVGTCTSELVRIGKPGALGVIDELYTYSILQKGRTSAALGRALSPKVRRRIYHGEEPYITPDERKMNESWLDVVCRALSKPHCRYFNVVVNRFLQIDRTLTGIMEPAGPLLVGRILLTGYVGR
jgi:hypothetical protein